MTTGTGARRASRRAGVGRERVVEVALRIFMQRGYAGTSMKSVASELGVSAPAIYWYFASKQELFVAVLEHAMADFLAFVRRSATDEDPLRALGQMVRAHVTWQLQQSEVARTFDLTMSVKAIGNDVSAERLHRVKSMEVEYMQEFRRVLAEGHRRGVMHVSDIPSTAFAIVTLCEYVHSWYRAHGRLGVEAVAECYEQMVYNMVLGDLRLSDGSEGRAESSSQ